MLVQKYDELIGEQTLEIQRQADRLAIIQAENDQLKLRLSNLESGMLDNAQAENDQLKLRINNLESGMLSRLALLETRVRGSCQ